MALRALIPWNSKEGPSASGVAELYAALNLGSFQDGDDCFDIASQRK